ncbi:type 3 dihydrofolate reductase [Alteromonas sediminis]|uniref:Dihydrofolate reductase n=1 Tax=Alteromonas sediminis TaxID=2259342 RepID=A0A3N5YLK7_9ALTE|nr:type 3 dihydrofolate reductase [Alteromonas sediminis]RPJ66051.1 type 3 dihydrofolate reductase [Alteromonas sediminis]
MSKLAMIAAMAHNRVIGANNDMPWHMPADLKHFKQVTLGKPVIMGRKTYESIGKALPGRQNIVITQQAEFTLPDAQVLNNIDDAVTLARQSDAEEIMIIGGGTLYQAMLPHADRLYLTFIDLDVSGDTYFPDYMSAAKWRETSKESHHADEKNPHDYTFVCLERA